MIRPARSSCRAARYRASRASAPGSPTGWGAKATTCRRSSSSRPTYPKTGPGQALYHRMWGSGFLPTRHNGVALRGTGDPVLYLANPDGVTTDDRRVMLDALGSLNAASSAATATPRPARGSLSTRWPSACRRSVPDLVDLASEPQARPRPVRSERHQPRHLRQQACWRGGWWSGGSAWCRSSIAAGTSSAISR